MSSIKTFFRSYVGDVKTTIWVLLFSIWLVLRLGWAFMVEKNDLQHFVVIEHRGGTLSVKRDPGHFIISINIPHYWEWTNSVWFSEFDEEGGRGDESVPLRFYDGAEGKQSGIMVYQFQEDTPNSMFIQMQNEYRGQQNFESRVIKPLTMESLKKSSSLLSSEESYTTRKKELGLMAEDQLQHGTYLTKVVRQEITDITGELVVGDVPRIRTDENGEPLRSGDKSLSDFNINVPVFSLYECQYDTTATQRIETKRSSKMDRIISIAKTKLATMEEYLEGIKGEVNVLRQKYEQQTENTKVIVAAQATQDTIRIQAETKNQVAQVRKSIADMKKQIGELQGRKEYKVRKLLMGADNQLQDRLNTWLAGQNAKAKAYQYSKGIFPSILLGSGSGNNNNIQDQAWQLFMLNEAKKTLANSRSSSEN